MPKSNKPIQAYLSYYVSLPQAVNTDASWSAQVRPNLDTSYASWQAVFDEVKVLSAELHYHIWWTVLPTAFAGQTPNSIVAYEPGVPVAMASVNAGMQYEKFQLCNVGATANGTYAVVPQNTAKGGFMVFKANMPDGPQQSNVNTLVSTGMWRPTTDASNYFWGAFQGYIAQGGATSSLQVECFVRMKCEFRARR